MVYVAYDPDLVDIGVIEPVFVEEITGWYTLKARFTGSLKVRRYQASEMASSIPVDCEPGEWVAEPLDTPVPRIERRLKWRKSEGL